MTEDLPNCTPAAIRSARQAAGLTQSAAAGQVHANWRTWQSWEYGDRRMPLAAWELFLRKTDQWPT